MEVLRILAVRAGLLRLQFGGGDDWTIIRKIPPPLSPPSIQHHYHIPNFCSTHYHPRRLRHRLDQLDGTCSTDYSASQYNHPFLFLFHHSPLIPRVYSKARRGESG